MNLEVEGVKLIVDPQKVEEKTKGGLYIPDTARDMQQVAATRGTVLAIGPQVEARFVTGPIEEGDSIIFPRYAGAMIEEDGKEYRVINDDDVLARVARGPY